MRILLVDDSHSAAMAMTARLHTYGHVVVRAADGHEAVEAFREHAPDLVLMDLEMPRLNGFDATNRIRAEESLEPGAWTPIIFLTASSHESSLVTAIEAGADDFISKSAPEPVLRAKMAAMARIAALRQRLWEANDRLRQLADLDGLTGLANRRSLDGRIDAQWRLAQRDATPFGILMMDIDHFKAYNDLYSHLGGDDCLRKVAQAIGAVAQAEGSDQVFAARYGGEEFVMVTAGLDREKTLGLAQRVVAEVGTLRLPHRGNPPWGIVTVSVGLAWSARGTGQAEDLLREADEALYCAKRGGRNRLAQHPAG
ncbi:MAG: diguanylate cyclase [Betaproteobacteria bacterium]|nr:diguanylate cyclase [Betaproteobacteria bacterium]MDE2152023.1 diguanylate cyclase [Betaproteobacteria bacterium]